MEFRGPSFKTIARQHGSRLQIRDQEFMRWFHFTWEGIKVEFTSFTENMGSECSTSVIVED